jgi:hypothetical protein
MKIQKFTKNRKAELTTKQLVMIIILIASFIIVLFLLFRLNLGETTNKEVCHNSVVLKGRLPLGGPLDCRTNYLCISGDGDCGEIPTTSTIEVDPNNKNETMKVLADEMSDCWWMFGEGKIRYTGGVSSTGVHCALCSVIEFSGISADSISYQEFYEYLRTTPKSESQTYLHYLYEINNLDLFESQEQIEINLLSDVIFTNQKYSIITGIDNNLIDFLGDDEWLKVYIIPTLETSATECDKFITKA